MNKPKRMTRLNPLFKPPDPLELEAEELLQPQLEETLPREAILRLLRENPNEALKRMRRWLEES